MNNYAQNYVAVVEAQNKTLTDARDVLQKAVDDLHVIVDGLDEGAAPMSPTKSLLNGTLMTLGSYLQSVSATLAQQAVAPPQS